MVCSVEDCPDRVGLMQATGIGPAKGVGDGYFNHVVHPH
jgi:hypothetical protein